MVDDEDTLHMNPSEQPAVSQVKYAKDVNLYVNEYIRFADLKAGAVLTLTIGVAAALAKALPAIFAAAGSSGKAQTILAIPTLIATVAGAMSIVFCALALIPRGEKQPSLNSYPDIAE